jgi:hypothetical protein
MTIIFTTLLCINFICETLYVHIILLAHLRLAAISFGCLFQEIEL